MSFRYMFMAKSNGGDVYFELHEVYFDDQGKPSAHTKNPVTLIGDSEEDVLEIGRYIQKASEDVIYWNGPKWPEVYRGKLKKTGATIVTNPDQIKKIRDSLKNPKAPQARPFPVPKKSVSELLGEIVDGK